MEAQRHRRAIRNKYVSRHASAQQFCVGLTELERPLAVHPLRSGVYREPWLGLG
jgi:hypothetical protein